MRRPRDLTEYSKATDVANFLEKMASEIRDLAAHRPLVRYSLALNYWNPDWADKSKPKPVVICQAATYGNRRSK